ncbi:MAG: DUF5658 family protein [Phycisphaerales bacterium]
MFRDPVLYPKAYWGYITLAVMDVLLTALILRLGGIEVNWIAAWVIEKARAIEATGYTGMTLFKFATVFFVLFACEVVGRRHAKAGTRLSRAAVLISVIPVAVAVLQLLDARALAGM